MTFVAIDTVLTRQVANDLRDVASRIGGSIENALEAQRLLTGYESKERSIEINRLLTMWLGEEGAPTMQQRMLVFANYLDDVASAYERMG